MNYTWRCILAGIGFSLNAVCASAELTLGVNTSTGSLLATDLWKSREYEAMTKDSGRQPDTKNGGLSDELGRGHYRFDFILAETFELARDGTNLTVTMIIAKYTLPTPIARNDFFRTLWLEARDQAGLLGATYYGYSSGYPSHYEDHQPISQLNLEVLSQEKTKAGEFLWLLKVQGSVTLTRPVNYLPDIKIEFQSWERHLNLTRFQKQATALYQHSQPPAAVAINLANHRPPQPTTNLSRQRPSQSEAAPSVLPGVTLSIAKQDGLLLITFSPVVAGANLEQAALNASPWVWQPAVTVTKATTNGWYVVPAPEPRIFRIRLDQ